MFPGCKATIKCRGLCFTFLPAMHLVATLQSQAQTLVTRGQEACEAERRFMQLVLLMYGLPRPPE